MRSGYRSQQLHSEAERYAGASRRIGDPAMVTVEGFSRLVAGIYEAAVTPQHWEPAIREIHRTLQAAHGALLKNDGTSRSIINGTLPMEASNSYIAHYHRLDYVLTAVETGPVGMVRTGSELTDPQRSCRSH